MCLIGANSENGTRKTWNWFLIDSLILKTAGFGRFARFGRPADPSAPKGRRFSRLWRDSRLHLQNSENEATLLAFLR